MSKKQSPENASVLTDEQATVKAQDLAAANPAAESDDGLTTDVATESPDNEAAATLAADGSPVKSEPTSYRSKNPKMAEFLRTLKYFACALSAGLIQLGVSTIFSEGCGWVRYPEDTAPANTANLFWVGYIIALALSVIWNFTFNRKFTFQSVANIPRAMGWTILYYAIFTPCSILWMDAWLKLDGWGNNLEVVVTLITILINGITEFLWQRLFIYRKSIDNNNLAKKHAEKEAQKSEKAAAALNASSVADAAPSVPSESEEAAALNASSVAVAAPSVPSEDV